jgi:hypothetical protein
LRIDARISLSSKGGGSETKRAETLLDPWALKLYLFEYEAFTWAQTSENCEPARTEALALFSSDWLELNATLASMFASVMW